MGMCCFLGDDLRLIFSTELFVLESRIFVYFSKFFRFGNLEYDYVMLVHSLSKFDLMR